MIRARAPHRRHRHGLELVPAGRLRLGARPLLAARRRDPRGRARVGRACASPGAIKKLARQARGADRGRVRVVLPSTPGSTRSSRSPPARSATPRTRPSCSSRCASHAGLDVRVLSTEDETRYGYLAIANTTTVDRRVRAWTWAAAASSSCGSRTGSLRESGSWPLGAVRMTEEFLPDDKADAQAAQGAAQARRQDRRRLRLAARRRAAARSPASAAPSATSRPRCRSARGHPDTGGVQGFRLTRDALEELIEELAAHAARPSAAACPASSPTAAT